MAQVITNAGEKLFATKAQANQQLDIDTFIFANVAGQDPAAAIDRNEDIPTAAIVHQQNVQQTGRINDNVVVYSTVLDSVTGPFEFNWVGLYSSVNQTLVAISHVPTVAKTITAPGSAGNTLNRNFGIEYSGIADLAGISVSPETWQLDFSARLSGMDELTRQLASDMNGKDWFIDDGFKVVPRSTANTFSVTPGVGYVSGLRVELKQEHILTLQTYPQFVYVDAYFDGNASSRWKPQVAFTVSNTEVDDYIDANGVQHYVFKLAVVSGDDLVDLRNNSGLKEEINKHKNNEVNAHKVAAIVFDEGFDIGDRGRQTNSADPMINVNRNVNNSVSGNGHCFSDSSLVDRSGGISYASYDARFDVEGSENYGHFAPFQNGMVYKSSGYTSIMYGYVDIPRYERGTVGSRYGAYIDDVRLSGGATLASNYGLYIPELTAGKNQNFAVVTKGNTKSLFEGGIYVEPKIKTGSLQVTGAAQFDDVCAAKKFTSLEGGGWLFDGSPSAGLRVQAGNGSSHDYALITNDASKFIQTVPTGTNEVKFWGNVSFNGAEPTSKPSVIGSRGGNAALASLISALAAYGLITDSTTG